MMSAARSAIAMGSALVLGLAYGEAADAGFVYILPFLVPAALSVVLLLVAGRRGVPSGTRYGRRRCQALGCVALLLVGFDAFSVVNRDTIVLQLLAILPFLVATGWAARQRARIAACGAGGFFATVVAMLWYNRWGSFGSFFVEGFYVYAV